MKLRYLAALTILAIIFGWLLTIPAEATDPPGNDGKCTHSQSHRDCRPDPQPDHGQDCESHGNNQDGNEDHCQTTSTPTPTTTVGPTSTVTPVSTSTPNPTVVPTTTPTPEATIITSLPTPTISDDCTNEDGTEPRGCAVCEVNGVILNAFDYPYECSYFHISPPSTGSGGLR